MSFARVRGRRPLRGSDYLDDDYSDVESISSSSSQSYSRHLNPDRQDQAPVFRLREDEQDKAVYEAWNIYYYPGMQDRVNGCKVLGLKFENYDEIPSRVELRRQPSAQSELANMHLQAIDAFGAKHKRCWPARIFQGKGKTYEQDLDERCRSAPSDVRKSVTNLLFNRGKTTSTRYRTRTWTVVALREQLQDRFVDTDFAEVKRHKLRVWKNPKPQDHLLYTVVIRGAQTKVVPAGEDGVYTFADNFNPWEQSDTVEIRCREREERERRDALRQKRRSLSPASRAASPSFRTRSPSYQARARSASPPSYRSWQSRYDSPPPSIPHSRSDSPPPYRRSTRSRSPIGSRSPSVRIRVVPRYTPTNFDDTPFAPTPPDMFTYRSGMGDAGGVGGRMPSRTPPPFHPRPPLPNPAMHRLAGAGGSPATSPHALYLSPLPTPATCQACRATRALSCAHQPQLYQPCYRPVLWYAGVAYHPPCARCAEQQAAAPLFGAPPPMHAAPPPPLPAQPAAPHPVGPFGQFAQQQFAGGGPYGYGWSGFGPAPRPPGSRPWSTASSVGPMPPAPNPFSPLSTPPLTSAGGSSVGGSSPVLGRARTPPAAEGERAVIEVVAEGSERVGSPALSFRAGAERGGLE